MGWGQAAKETMHKKNNISSRSGEVFENTPLIEKLNSRETI